MKAIVPPFTRQTATRKVRLAEDARNFRDPDGVPMAYSVDCRWRNRSEFIQGREAILACRARSPTHRVVKELWAFGNDRIAVR